MLARKYSVNTNHLKIPSGMSPNDPEAIKIAKRAIKGMSGAEEVDISFDEGPDGQPLLDHMNVHATFPTRIGKYVSLAAVDSDDAEVIGDLLEDLAGDRDPSENLKKLQDQLGDKDSEDGKPEEDSGSSDSPEGSESAGGPPESSPEEGKPDPSKPRMPFANKNTSKNPNSQIKQARDLSKSKDVSLKTAVISLRMANYDNRLATSYIKRAQKIAEEFGIEGADALEVVETAENSNNFNEFYEETSEALEDSEGNQFSREQLARLGAIAKGLPLGETKGKAPLGQGR